MARPLSRTQSGAPKKLKTETGNVKVMVRVRPFSQREQDYSAAKGRELRPMIAVDGARVAVLDAENGYREKDAYEYDNVFWSCSGHDCLSGMADQQDVYAKTGAVMLEAALAGYNCCIFAYGQTGSGKTYTMLGSPTSRGVSYLLIDALFAHIKRQKTEDPGTMVTVEVSFMEIYNEQVRDLFNKKQQQGEYAPIRIRQDPVKGILVVGLLSKPVSSAAECTKEMERGVQERALAETKMNATSSRSHAICQISIVQANPATGLRRNALINLVDLAGSERLKMSQVQGTAATEAKNINLSLSTLRKVFDTLIANSKKKNPKSHEVPPYRESMLTWVLKESLGGNSKTMMIAAISPHEENIEDTTSTLRYALKAKSIVCKVICNEQPSAKVVENLKDQIETLKRQLSTQGSGMNSEERAELQAQYEEELKSNQEALEEAMDVERKMVAAKAELEEAVQHLELEKTAMRLDINEHKRQKFASAFRSAFAIKKGSNELSELKAEVQQLRRTTNEHKSKNAALQETVNSLQSQLMREQMSTHRETDTLARQLQQYKSKVLRVDNDLNETQFKRRELELAKQTLSDLLASKEDAVNSLLAERNALKTENDHMRREVGLDYTRIKAKLDEVEADRDELLRKKNAYKKQCAALQLIHEADSKIIDSLRVDKRAIQERLHQQAMPSGQVDGGVADLEQATRQASRLREEMALRDRDMRQLTDNLRALQRNVTTDYGGGNASVRRELERVTREAADLRSAPTAVWMASSPALSGSPLSGKSSASARGRSPRIISISPPDHRYGSP
ncbi:Kinesin-like protein unc-104 [Diplonema papillatum]|nr:Kinesin-like protein unc-104 [Diplonema papillatum]